MLRKSFLPAVVVLLLVTLAQPAAAQSRYLFGSGNDISAFGGPFVEMGNVNGEFGVLVGGGGALLIDDAFYFGGYGIGLTTEQLQTVDELGGIDADLDFNHGGFWLGVSVPARSAVHLTASTRLGWGTARWNEPGTDNRIASDDIFVISPNIGIELNLTDWFRFSVEGGYRIVTGLDMVGIGPKDLDGANVMLGFRFGGF